MNGTESGRAVYRERSTEELAAELDRWVERLLAGDDTRASASAAGPEQSIEQLVEIARNVRINAATMTDLRPDAKKRIWRRVKRAQSLLHRILFYRLPYLPPLWLKAEAC